MFDYVEQLPNGILKVLLSIVSIFYYTCIAIFEYGTKTLREIIVQIMTDFDISETIVNAVNAILSGKWAWIYNISLFEILLGGALIAVVVFGMIKYFTDIVL